MIRLYYVQDNAKTALLHSNGQDRFEVYICDGSSDFPILDTEVEANAYLMRVMEFYENLGGADIHLNSDDFNSLVSWYVEHDGVPGDPEQTKVYAMLCSVSEEDR